MKLFKFLLFLSSLSLFAHAFTPSEAWSDFKSTHSKSYSPSEEPPRFQIFLSNLQIIDQIQQADPNAVYGITKFSDLTPEEFQTLYLSPIDESKEQFPPSKTYQRSSLLSDSVPDSWNWTAEGAVTPVKDQGICGGAYWAFSAIAAIESQYYLIYNVSYNFSEQQLIDCDTADKGCYGGGSITGAYSYLQQAGGLESSKNYPYFGYSMPCAYNSSFASTKVTGYMNISQDESEIAEALYEKGPLSTYINAYWLQFYKKGVMTPLKCDKEKLNHAVTLVGYGVEQDKKDVEYWIAKNSWGSGWGEDGYFRIKRGDGVCGINLNVSLPIIG